MKIIAYVDPGTGLAVIQMAVAAVAGFVFTLKRFRERIFRLFRKEPTPPVTDAPLDPESEQEQSEAKKSRGTPEDRIEIKN